MYLINDKLAVHGFDFNPQTYELAVNYDYSKWSYGYISSKKHSRTGQYLDNFRIIDCRNIPDDEFSVKWKTYHNKPIRYKRHIAKAINYLNDGEKVVCCCSAGQSRSSAIALGILVEYNHMNFYDAWNLIREKNPLCNIAMHHLDVLKHMYKVKLP